MLEFIGTFLLPSSALFATLLTDRPNSASSGSLESDDHAPSLFNPTRVTRLGIFLGNIVVDAVVWAVLDAVCGPQDPQHDLGWAAGERNLIFYTDDGRMAGQDHKWVQDTLSVAVAMFYIMGLETNLDNTKAVVCTPCFIWGKWGGQAYKRRVVGEGATFQESKRLRVSCTKYGVAVSQYSLKQHMKILHGICVTLTRGFGNKGEGTTTYVVPLLRVLQSVRCPVPGCPAV